MSECCSSAIHRWNPACRFAGFISLAASMSFADSIPLVLICLAFASVLIIISGLSFLEVVVRLRYPMILAAVVSALLAFSGEGNTVRVISFVRVSLTGLTRGLLFSGRLASVLATTVVLFSAFPLVDNLRGMRRLGLPSFMVDMVMLTGRFIHGFRSNVTVMRNALRLRGCSFRRMRLGVMAMLTGSVMISGFRQAEDVYRAIILRGGSASLGSRSEVPGAKDILVLALVLLLALGIVMESQIEGIIG